jgi:peptide/nickel transport system permease protein
VEEKQEYAISSITKSSSYNINNIIIQKTFWLGTDKFGRDILSRLLIGIRVSLSVGLIAVIISLTIGILLGSFAGYFRGKTDDVIMWFINVIWSIPTLLLVFAITLALGKGFWQVFIAVGLTMWVSVARLIRGQVLSLRELEYIEAAKALGYSHTRIIMRHILPNVMGPVIVIAASNFATAIVIEAGLSFLGVGVQAPQPSWGLMIKENYNFIITHNPFLAIAPGIAIMILVLAFNLLGNGLRDALDVKGKL